MRKPELDDETETIWCHMRSGHARTFGRLPGQPCVPGTPGMLTVSKRTAIEFRNRCDVVVLAGPPSKAAASSAKPQGAAVAPDVHRAKTADGEEPGPSGTRKRRTKTGGDW
jgi:hypothetical protein